MHHRINFAPGDTVQVLFNGAQVDAQQADINGLVSYPRPGIFPYTNVNGSTFPAPDAAMKASTPPVTDPNYSTAIVLFVSQNVSDVFNGQQVNFLTYFDNQGGLPIWGAPISNPAPAPSNSGFIYQRFQRGIMHYIQGTGTESILIADYLKAVRVRSWLTEAVWRFSALPPMPRDGMTRQRCGPP